MSYLSTLSALGLLVLAPSLTRTIPLESLCTPAGRMACQPAGVVPYRLLLSTEARQLQLPPGSILALPLANATTSTYDFKLSRETASSTFFVDTDRDPQHGFGRMLSCSPSGELSVLGQEIDERILAGEELELHLDYFAQASGTQDEVHLMVLGPGFLRRFELAMPRPTDALPQLLLACPPGGGGMRLLELRR